MEQSTYETIREFARSTLARLADLATPEAHAAADRIQAANRDWERSLAFARLLDGVGQLADLVAHIQKWGPEAVYAAAPFVTDADNPERLDPVAEERARLKALDATVGFLASARITLIEALTGNVLGSEERLEEPRAKLASAAEAALRAVEDALRSAEDLVGAPSATTQVTDAPRPPRGRRPKGNSK